MTLRTTLIRALVVLLASCGMAGLAVPVAATAGATPPRLLRVVSYNMHHGVGVDGVLDLRRIAAAVRGADVVGLQEVDRHYSARSDWADQAGELGRLLGYHVAFGANIDDDPPPGRTQRVQYGTAILSRYPIVLAHNTPLPVTPGQEPRGLLHAELDVRGVRVQVYDTHLGDRLAVDRQRQADVLAATVPARAPAVLVGDLNATPEAREIRTVAGVLRDAWRVGAGLTYPAEAPTKRIDYLFTSAAVHPLSAKVGRTQASDHLPLTVSLLLR